MAHCAVMDLDNNALLMDEAVRNGETYKLMRFGDVIFLDSKTITTTQSMMQHDSLETEWSSWTPCQRRCDGTIHKEN